ncbi:MAG: response regulator [Anaerolineales bacterium]|nr:response regulator [Anaerolineales bacterium]
MDTTERILIVDDEDKVRELIKLALAEEGYLVETAKDGQHALEILTADQAFELIITDLMMPGISGLDVLTRVKSHLPTTEVILITAHGALNTAIEALRQGAHDYLTKPFNLEELIHSVQQALAYRRLKLEKEDLLANLQLQVSARNAMVKAGQRIVTVLDQQEVIHTVLEAAIEIFPQVELVLIYFKVTETELKVTGLTGERVEIPISPLTDTVIAEVLQSKQTLYQPHWLSPKDFSFSPTRQAQGDQRPEADSLATEERLLVIEPMTLAGVSLGALAIVSLRPAAFNSDYSQLLTMLANQAAIAIQNARLYAEARRVDELEALSEAGQALNRHLDLQETLTTTLAITRSLTGASIGNIYLYSPDSHRIGPVITLGEELILSDADRRQSAEIAWNLLKHYEDNHHIEQEVTVINVQASPTTLTETPIDSYKILTWMAVPLVRTSNPPVGVLELGSEKSNSFSTDDVRLVQVIAAQATTAIENARLYEEVRQRLKQLAHQQEEILRSHRTLQALFDGITDGLYIVDRHLRIVAINQAEAKRLDRTSESLLGQTCDTSLWNEATSAMTRIVLNTFETGSEGNWESQTDSPHRGPFTDRDVRTYPIFLVPTSSNFFRQDEKDAKVSQVIILAQDVSEKRQLQASLFRSANLAAVGRLASSIAHQINNPLTVVIANSQLMQLEASLDSPDYPIIQDIVEAGTQIRQIVQNLLDFSTQDSYEWFETDIEDTLEDALALVAHPLRKSNIEVIKRVDQLNPIIGSASHLKMLWMNLLLNARDAIIERGERGHVRITAAKSEANFIQVQITDNGQGIAPEYQEHLFRPFFTTKSPGQGLGLGLYTCRTIVEYHQGNITINNNQGSPGVTVTVTLPLKNDNR